jgi:hypothetical protein
MTLFAFSSLEHPRKERYEFIPMKFMMTFWTFTSSKENTSLTRMPSFYKDGGKTSKTCSKYEKYDSKFYWHI